MTALTGFATATNATTLTTARQLGTAAAGTATTVATTVAKRTGLHELFSQGGNAGASLAATGTAITSIATQVHGFLLDATTLELQTLTSGSVQPTLRVQASSASISGKCHVRYWKRSAAGVYTLVATFTEASASAFTTSAATRTLPAATITQTDFATGDKFYAEVVVDVTANTANSTTSSVSVVELGTTAGQLATFPTAGFAPAAQTVSPSGIASGEAFGADTVSPGPVSVSPTGIASAEQFGADTVSPGPAHVAPSGIASGEAFGADTVSPGPAHVAPSGIASGEAFGADTVSPGPVHIDPTGIASAEQFGADTVSPGPVSVSPTGIASGEAFGADTVTAGSHPGQSVTPSGVASGEAFGTDTVSPGPVHVGPSGVVSGEAFGTDTVSPGPVSVSPTGIATAEAVGSPTVNAARPNKGGHSSHEKGEVNCHGNDRPVAMSSASAAVHVVGSSIAAEGGTE